MEKIEKDLVVLNKKGLHARPAAMFVQLVDKFNVTATIIKGSEKVNAKSIMGILMLGAQCGTVLKIVVEGQEAQLAMNAFEKFLNAQEEDFNS